MTPITGSTAAPGADGTGPRGAAARAPFAKVSSAGRDVLVVGSYPPVPTAGAPVTVETVRRLWAEGARPYVAAPRASAAPLTVAVTGLLAGHRLANLRCLTGSDDVVFCVERDLPIPTGGYPGLLPLVQRLSAQRVCEALRAFEHVTLIACGDHGIPPAVWAQLVFAADTVIDRSDVAGTTGVTTLGPSGPPGLQLARRAAAVAPRLLGRHTPRVRAVVVTGSRVARRARDRLGHQRPGRRAGSWPTPPGPDRRPR